MTDNNAFVEQLERTGGFAYPSDCFSPPGGGTFVSAGMTLLDWFAGQALISIADDCGMTDAETAERCYQRAAAMLAERVKP